MGGTIKVAIRFEDGSRWVGTCWANTLNGCLHDLRMLTEPDKVLREYTKRIPDYNLADKTLVPIGNGLVAIDAVAKRVYSFNDYSTFGNTTVFGILNGNPEEVEKIEELYRAGKLTVYCYDGKTPHNKIIFDLCPKTDPMIELAILMLPREFLRAEIDMSPWVLAIDQHKPNRDFLDFLEAGGFPVTAEDRKVVARWFRWNSI